MRRVRNDSNEGSPQKTSGVGKGSHFPSCSDGTEYTPGTSLSQVSLHIPRPGCSDEPRPLSRRSLRQASAQRPHTDPNECDRFQAVLYNVRESNPSHCCCSPPSSLESPLGPLPPRRQVGLGRPVRDGGSDQARRGHLTPRRNLGVPRDGGRREGGSVVGSGAAVRGERGEVTLGVGGGGGVGQAEG